MNKQRVKTDFTKYRIKIKNKKALYGILGAVTALITFIAVYFMLMPINFASGGFRAYLVLIFLLWSIPLFCENKYTGEKTAKMKSPSVIPLAAAGTLIALFVIMIAATSPLFLSGSYRSLITVEDKSSEDFKTEVENYSTMLIPTVDKELAEKLGDKKMGEDNYGSQFEVGSYTLIENNGEIFWIAPIEYRGFFQWISRASTPGYVLVNARDQQDVKIIKQDLSYVRSAYLWDNLERKMYFSNIFKLRDKNPHLEVDPDGNPVYIDAALTKKFAFFGGTDTDGVFITDAVTGESKYYDNSEVPDWVDRAHTEDIVETQLNDWGEYIHGFFNSVFAKKDVLAVSDGINYIFSNGDLYLYTGLTSVGSDESIVGMSLTNMRTKQSSLYRVSGATEWAAQTSAQGVEQDMNFTASYPVLINYNGVPTYFMLLKTSAGLVERYAYVNVADYTVVSTARTKEEALSLYAMKITPDLVKTETFTVKEIHSAVTGGETYYYVKFYSPFEEGDADYTEDFEDIIFKIGIKQYDGMPFITSGDYLKITYLISGGQYTVREVSKP